jgi:hypothetical protein
MYNKGEAQFMNKCRNNFLINNKDSNQELPFLKFKNIRF